MEKERAKKKVLRLPGFPRVEIPRFLQSFGTMLANKRLMPAGRFLELSFLDTFKDKRPKSEDIEKFQQISRELELPPEVLRALNKLKNATTKNDIKDICEEIEKIFFLSIKGGGTPNPFTVSLMMFFRGVIPKACFFCMLF